MMYALLVLNSGKGNARYLVRVAEGRQTTRLNVLIRSNRNKEAFTYLINNAEIEEYLFHGTKLKVLPDVTLIEDLL